MASLWPRSLLLGVAALLLLAAGGSGSSSSHSMRYFYMGVSEPGPGLPHFVAVGYVDDQPFTKYDTVSRRAVPLVPWLEEAAKEDPHYWEYNSNNFRGSEASFKVNLETLRERFHQNSSTGLHTFQWMYGCEVGSDGRPSGGHDQFAYDGEDFLTLDLETVTYTARVHQAEATKRKWEGEAQVAQHNKNYLEEICTPWLRKYLGYGAETLQRTETPTGKVAHKKGYDGQETLFCQLYGFYPKDIEVTWMKDGEERKPDTLTGGVTPNSDGTYHTWLSIEVDPEERGRYRCHVEHDSLPEPLDLACEEPASSVGLIVGICVGVLAAILVGAVAIFYIIKKRNRGYKATPGSDQGSDNSTKVNIPA